MKFNQLRHNFTSGELSELLVGRVDLEEWHNGLATMKNFYPLKQGGARYRAGTRWFHTQDTGAGETSNPLLADFYSADYTYAVVVEPGKSKLQVYRTNDGTACTIGGFSDIFWVNDPTWTTVLPADNLTYTQEQRFQLQFAQQGDVMFFVDGTGRAAPWILVRTGATSFEAYPFLYLSPSGFAQTKTPLRYAYNDPNVTATTITPSATSGNITLTASTSIFTGSWTGRMVKITHAGTTGVAYVTSKTSDTILNATVQVNFGATTASTFWETSAWGGDKGYPRAITFFEARLWFGGCPGSPDTCWGSEVGDVFHFMQRRLSQDSSSDVSGLNYFGAVAATDPFSFIPASREANNIQWLASGRELQVGTQRTEFLVTGGQDQALSLSSIFVKDISNHGSSKVMPRRVGGDTIFVGTDGRTLRALTAQSESQGVCPELSVISDGLVESAATGKSFDILSNTKISWMVWNDTYSSLFLIVQAGDTAGSLSAIPRIVAFAYDKSSKMIAFWRHEFKGGTTAVTGICSLPDHWDPDPDNVSVATTSEIKSNALWMVATRFNGVGVTIERMNAPRDIETAGTRRDGSNAFLDAFRTYFKYSGASIGSATIATGYASGVVLDVVCDGDYIGTRTVDGSGNITVPSSTYKIVSWGFKYDGTLKLLPVEAGQTFGQAQGSPRRVTDFIIRLFRARGGKYFMAGTNEYALLLDSEATVSAFYSGEKKLIADGTNWDTQLTVKQDVPYPMTILWILQRGVTNDA